MPVKEYKTLSRFFTVPKIPRPTNLDLEYNYNFFVPDEAVSPEEGSVLQENNFTFSYIQKDDDGVAYTHDPVSGKKYRYFKGQLVTDDTLKRAVPRFVQAFWSLSTNIPTLDQTGELPSIKELDESNLIIREEEISSVYDVNIRSVDLELRDRIYKKTKLLGKLVNKNEEPHKAASSYMLNSKELKALKIKTEHTDKIKLLFDLNAPESTKRVNEIGNPLEVQQFREAEEHMPDFQYDRRLIENAANSYLINSNTSARKLQKFIESEADLIKLLPAEPAKPPFTESSLENYQATISDIITETPYLPAQIITNRILNQKVSNGDPKINQFAVMGFIVERHSQNQLGSEPTETFYVETPSSRDLVDSDVVYGETYLYSVRAVYIREAFIQVFDETGAKVGIELVRQFIASRPSLVNSIETIETTPPAEPDAVFFRFNFERKKGLMISWQYPVGRSRDTKYFQIFRRKTIHEPFVCIAELDFNNSIIKSLRREKVIDENVIKKNGPITFYEDPEFDRQSSYIYAVASVDAHGLTSGYSYQTRVSFDVNTNRIQLKGISRSGAPKQYPNFYVDPDEDATLNIQTLTQDVISSSMKQRVKIYLDPTCEIYTNSTGEKRHLVNLTTSTSGGPVYKMHFLNLDRQKDDSIEIRIRDVRSDIDT